MTKKIDTTDKRWGGYVPWFFRHDDYTGTGDYLLFFERLCQRSFQLFYYNELGITDMNHLGSILESKSLHRYKNEYNPKYGNYSFVYGIRNYFSPENIKVKEDEYLYRSPIRDKMNRQGDLLEKAGWDPNINLVPENLKNIFQEYKKYESELQKLIEEHHRTLLVERLGVLEVMLRILPKGSDWFNDFVKDIRCYLAEAGLMLDINEGNYSIDLLEEPLLQKEVLENLLPRLKAKFPERADELIKAYHGMLSGSNFDDIFIGAFKTLEEIARSVTKDNKFEFNQSSLDKHFPKLHKTTHATIIKLAGHRGDKGGHGRDIPEAIEMRYLLFSICNFALLMLDYEG